MKRGVILLTLSATFWLLLGAWILAPGWLSAMAHVWELLGSPGWFARIGYVFLTTFVILVGGVHAWRSDT